MSGFEPNIQENGAVKKRPVHEDHEEHVDERWLVSYADMMTLLFGLFVMLYSMQDPQQMKAMHESIKERFGQNEKPKENEIPPAEKIAHLEKVREDLKNQIEVAQKKNQEIQQKLDESSALSESSQKQIEESKKKITDLESKLTELQEAARLKNQNVNDSKNANSQLKSEIDNLNEKMKSINLEKLNIQKEVEKTKATLAQRDEKIEQLNAKLSAKEEKPQVNKVAEIPKEKHDKALREIERLKEELERKTEKTSKGQFVAVVTSWLTNDHDIDLVVTDPKGKIFNFKNRSHANHPGKLVLDSRRGPGAEVWQSDRILPGKYKADVIFYNQYGNTAAAEVKLVIFASGGNVELPIIKMDFTNEKRKTVEFNIDENGKIQILGN